MLRQLASFSFRHRLGALALWLVVGLGTFVVGSTLAGPESGGSIETTDAGRAHQLLADGFGTTGEAIPIVVADPAGVGRHANEIAAAAERLRAVPGVAGVTTSAEQPDLASPDGVASLVVVDLITTDDATLAAIAATRDDLAATGLTAELASGWFSEVEMPASELFGIAAAAVILLLAFGSVVAMGLPLITAVLGVAAALGLVGLWAHLVATPDFAAQIAAMIGLGVGIDYALLIVTRYRQELMAGRTFHDAAVEAVATAGRAVVVAGATVVISLLGMLLVGLDIMRGVGVTAASAVVVAVAAAVTLLPALLGLVGHRIDALALRPRRSSPTTNPTSAPDAGLWHRWSLVVQRHPAGAAFAGTTLLLVIASPVAALRLATADLGNDPEGTTTRVAHDLVAEHFGPGVNGPLVVAVPATDPALVATLAARIATLDSVATVAPVAFASNGTAAVTLIPTTGPQDAATADLVHQLRDEVIPASGLVAHVGGSTAFDVDFADLMASRLPWFMAAVLTGSFLLLMVEFRSLVVPLKAVILNLLSIGGAYGVLVAVFQWGWFGLAAPGPIEPWAPMLLFAIVFGLSMDYEIFLLTAIRERFDRTGSASGSVAAGLAGTARVITAAAAIMICVFGSFIASDVRALRLFGLGAAAAVFIDATIVRLVLVPATMELLGTRNWWLPSPLDRLIPGHRPSTALPAMAAETG